MVRNLVLQAVRLSYLAHFHLLVPVHSKRESQLGLACHGGSLLLRSHLVFLQSFGCSSSTSVARRWCLRLGVSFGFVPSLIPYHDRLVFSSSIRIVFRSCYIRYLDVFSITYTTSIPCDCPRSYARLSRSSIQYLHQFKRSPELLVIPLFLIRRKSTPHILLPLNSPCRRLKHQPQHIPQSPLPYIP